MPSLNMVSYYPGPQQTIQPMPLQSATYPSVYPQQRQQQMVYSPMPPFYPTASQQAYFRPNQVQQPQPQVLYVPVFSQPAQPIATGKDNFQLNPKSGPEIIDKAKPNSIIDPKNSDEKIDKDKAAEHALANIIMQYAKKNPGMRALMTTENLLQLEKSLKNPEASLSDLMEKIIVQPLRQELHAKGITGFFRRQTARTFLYSTKRFLNRIPMTTGYREQLNQFFDDLKSPVKAEKKSSKLALAS